MGRELRRVVTEARLGRPLEESLDAVAERMDSKDFAWAVMAIRIQREVGGNLSELLMTVAETMTAARAAAPRRQVAHRRRAHQRLRARRAARRRSASRCTCINPDYMTVLFDETIGQIMLGGGVLLMVGGFVWMQKIVKIDV